MSANLSSSEPHADALTISNEQTRAAHQTQVAELEARIRNLESNETELRKRPTLPQHELVNTSLKDAQSALRELQMKFDKATTASKSLQREFRETREAHISLRVDHEALQIDMKFLPTHHDYAVVTADATRWKKLSKKTPKTKRKWKRSGPSFRQIFKCSAGKPKTRRRNVFATELLTPVSTPCAACSMLREAKQRNPNKSIPRPGKYWRALKRTCRVS
jgi:TolA-binding protein